MVLRLPASQSPRKVTFSARESAPLVAGQAISLLSLLGAIALVIWLAVRGRRDVTSSAVMRIAEFCRRRVLWLIPIGVCLLLIAPMAFTQRTFSADWTNHGLGRLAAEAQHPGPRASELFHPEQRARGLLSVLRLLRRHALRDRGLLALPLGAINAVVVLYFAAFLAAYCGWTWLSMQAGLTGLAAYLPGAIAVTAPFAITTAYGRGDFAETVATSMIPLILASGLSIFRADQLRAAPVAAFVFSVAILTGSHTLTLLWGSTFLLAAVAIAAFSWGGLVRARAGRLVQLAGLSLLGLGMSLWFLVPLVTYSKRHRDQPETAQSLSEGAYTSIGEIFRPLRSTPQVPPDGFAVIQAQLPVLALVCAVVLLGIAWRRLSRGRRSLFVGLAALLGLVTLLSTTPSLFEHLPRYWRYVQFT